MLEFEWDAAKAQANLRKHGVSFEEARQAFTDRYAVEFLDDRFDYGEERYVRIVLVGTRVLRVVYAERGDNRVRIISAGPASRLEIDEYYKERR